MFGGACIVLLVDRIMCLILNLHFFFVFFWWKIQNTWRESEEGITKSMLSICSGSQLRGKGQVFSTVTLVGEVDKDNIKTILVTSKAPLLPSALSFAEGAETRALVCTPSYVCICVKPWPLATSAWVHVSFFFFSWPDLPWVNSGLSDIHTHTKSTCCFLYGK